MKRVLMLVPGMLLAVAPAMAQMPAGSDHHLVDRSPARICGRETESHRDGRQDARS